MGTNTGNLISKLRKEAGYTQESLAKALNVTDKAISKWERGICLPDSSLLPQISKLLDCDIEVLISGLSDYKNHEWTGFLILEEGETSASTIVYDKPLINYLLSYFLLVGITTIDVKCSRKEQDYICSLNLEQYGFKISFDQHIRANTMVVYGKAIIFGANLTRVFQNYMTMDDKNIIPVIDDIELPMGFVHYTIDKQVIEKLSERKRMTRGMIYLPLNTKKEVKDASEFVRIYQNSHNMKIADLNEISINRRIKKNN